MSSHVPNVYIQWQIGTSCELDHQCAEGALTSGERHVVVFVVERRVDQSEQNMLHNRSWQVSWDAARSPSNNNVST